MQEYKEGDKVTIRKDAIPRSGGVTWIDYMDKTRGQVGVVDDVEPFGNDRVRVKFPNGNSFWYDKEHIERESSGNRKLALDLFSPDGPVITLNQNN